jgi:hypothetical protein
MGTSAHLTLHGVLSSFFSPFRAQNDSSVKVKDGIGCVQHCRLVDSEPLCIQQVYYSYAQLLFWGSGVGRGWSRSWGRQK